MSFLKKIVPDVLFVAGAASLSYGAWLIYPPFGFMVPGAIAVLVAVRLG